MTAQSKCGIGANGVMEEMTRKQTSNFSPN